MNAGSIVDTPLGDRQAIKPVEPEATLRVTEAVRPEAHRVIYTGNPSPAVLR